jgi:hypothetical protein
MLLSLTTLVLLILILTGTLRVHCVAAHEPFKRLLAVNPMALTDKCGICADGTCCANGDHTQCCAGVKNATCCEACPEQGCCPENYVCDCENKRCLDMSGNSVRPMSSLRLST